VDVQHHPCPVDIRDLQVRPFQQAQPAGVDGGQADAVDGNAHLGQNPPDFLPAQDYREFLLARGPHEPERGPVALQRVLVEELDPAQGNGGGGAGHLLLGGQVQEVPAQILLAEAVGAGMVMGGELADGGDVALLRASGEPPQLHVLDHPLA
jgi:hypothetical protein